MAAAEWLGSAFYARRHLGRIPEGRLEGRKPGVRVPECRLELGRDQPDSIPEISSLQACFPERGPVDLGPSEDRGAQDGMVELGIPKVGRGEIGGAQIGSPERGLGETCAPQQRTAEHGMIEVGPAQIRTFEIGVAELGTP